MNEQHINSRICRAHKLVTSIVIARMKNFIISIKLIHVIVEWFFLNFSDEEERKNRGISKYFSKIIMFFSASLTDQPLDHLGS